MKFSIRDLMFVTVIVALALAWWLDRGRLTSSHSVAVKKLEDELAKERASAETAWHALSHSYEPDPQAPDTNPAKN